MKGWSLLNGCRMNFSHRKIWENHETKIDFSFGSSSVFSDWHPNKEKNQEVKLDALYQAENGSISDEAFFSFFSAFSIQVMSLSFSVVFFLLFNPTETSYVLRYTKMHLYKWVNCSVFFCVHIRCQISVLIYLTLFFLFKHHQSQLNQSYLFFLFSIQ